MRLKRLTLHGFKTFADKTEIQFASGVTAVVGPNGSGKSNVADAITWVLGEQKASSLRASRAQDVIFAGSARRKPMGMAEVSLTVENEDGFLPLAFSEVTITRRIYRSGEGEYLLNKVPCRLKDITDLFLDTGVGRGAYAIVNQSEIDSILSARPEDRRELFEEAAGVKKYRTRRREAQRKLEQTEANLLRIHDIASEVAGGLKPLEAQATTAKRYDELSKRLREIEVGMLAADYKRLLEERKSSEAIIATATGALEAGHNEIEQLEKEASDLDSKYREAETAMERAQSARQRASGEGERLRSEIALAEERQANAGRLLDSVAQEVSRLEAERGRLQEEAQAQRTEADAAEARVAELGKSLSAAEDEVRHADRGLSELSRLAAGQEADYLELARRLASQKAQLAALRTRLTQQEKEIAEATTRAEQRRLEAEKAEIESTALSQRAKEAQSVLEEMQKTLTDTLEPTRRQWTERVQHLTEQRNTLQRELAGLQARLHALEEMEATQEGYFGGVRSVVRAAQAGRLKGNYRLVADILRVPAYLDTAIETALGSSLQDIVTTTEQEAKSAITFLNETRGGRATFLPLDALRSTEIPDSLRRAAKEFEGVLGSAADLVEYEGDVDAAVRVLLARVLFVEDLEVATHVSRLSQSSTKFSRDWAKIVTLKGEVVVPSGAITGGTQNRAAPNLLGRKREISELTQAVERKRLEADQIEQTESHAQKELETSRQVLREGETRLTAAREAAADAQRQVKTRQTEAERLRKEAEGFHQRVQAQINAAALDTERVNNLETTINASGAQDVGAQESREGRARQQAALTVQRDKAQSVIRSISSDLATLRERSRALKTAAARARDGVNNTQRTITERNRRAEEAQIILSEEKEKSAARAAQQLTIRGQLESAEREVMQWREYRQALLAQIAGLRESVRKTTRTMESERERAQTARLKIARLEGQAESIGQRLLSEYELHPDSAVVLTGGQPVDKDTGQEITRLRREIKALGTVNSGAIEEYERLEARHRFLNEQQDDLQTARERLTVAITEIDQATRGVFMETYKAVGVAFDRLFARLFGGGTTELLLTNPEDILETGIEILAQPPGKKRQSLALLSGGERALTATALLFAFLEVRPAPFCLMDEVDAPLDGANVEKFTDLLRDFGSRSQFIIITHNATTMEAAPLWYGITMQEPGVSRGLSLRVPDGSDPDKTSEPTQEKNREAVLV